jgi:hypothetical protein
MLAVVAGLMVAFASAAAAYWTVTTIFGSGAYALGRANALPAGVTPATPTKNAANGNTVTTTFAPVTMTGMPAVAATGYKLLRYDVATATRLVTAAACTGTTTITCVESSVPDGNWYYADYPTYGTNWVGADSGRTSTITVDKTAPTVTGVSSTVADGSYKQGLVVPVTVSFSEAVTVVGTPQLTLSTGSPATTAVNYTSGSGTSTLTFNYTVAAGNTSADLDYVLSTSLSAGTSIRDAVGNDATRTLASPGASGSLGFAKNLVIDTTAPTLSSIALAAASPTNAAGASWTVTFSEPVSGLTNSNFSLVNSGLTVPSLTSTTPSGGAPSATWTVVASTGTGSGTLGLNLANNMNVADVATNGLSTATFTGAVYTIDKTAPTISSVFVTNGGTSGKLDSGDSITVVFSETMSVSSLCTTWLGDASNQSLATNADAVVVTATDNATNDSLSVSSPACTLRLGTVSTGANYVTGGNVTFSGTGSGKSSVAWTAATKTLVITLGSNGGGGTQVIGVGNTTMTYTPSAAATDSAGNGVTGTASTASTKF